MSATPACMGGWCALRDHCNHYHADHRSEPSERLCVPGHDGFSDITPVRITRPRKDWDRPDPRETREAA